MGTRVCSPVLLSTPLFSLETCSYVSTLCLFFQLSVVSRDLNACGSA
jgi:hypothetical protein